MKVKSEHRSKFSNLSNWKVRASTGFEPVTSAIPVRCSTNWAMKPLIAHEAHCLNIFSFTMFEEIYCRRRNVKGNLRLFPDPVGEIIKTSQPLRQATTTFLWFSLISSKFSLKFSASCTIILIPWSRVSTTVGDQVSRKIASTYVMVSDWRLLLPHPQTYCWPKIWSVEYGALQVRKVCFSPHWTPTKRDFEKVCILNKIHLSLFKASVQRLCPSFSPGIWSFWGLANEKKKRPFFMCLSSY